MMRDTHGNDKEILWICHVPECNLAHFAWRKKCVCCSAARDLAKEPKTFDPAKHLAKALKRSGDATPQPPMASTPKAKAQPPRRKVQIGPAPKEQEAAVPEVAVQSSELPASKPGQCPDTAMSDGEGEEEQSLESEVDDYVPPILDARNVRMLLEENMEIAIQYKEHFHVQNQASSELEAQVALLEKKLSSMQITNEGGLWSAEIKTTEATLETMRAKLGTSAQSVVSEGTGDSPNVARITLMLDKHVTLMAKRESDHEKNVEDLESQIASLQAELAQAQKANLRKAAKDEALKIACETRMAQGKTTADVIATAIAKNAQMEVLSSKMQAAMSPEWIVQHNLTGVPTQTWNAILAQLMSVVTDTIQPAVAAVPNCNTRNWADASLAASAATAP